MEQEVNRIDLQGSTKKTTEKASSEMKNTNFHDIVEKIKNKESYKKWIDKTDIPIKKQKDICPKHKIEKIKVKELHWSLCPECEKEKKKIEKQEIIDLRINNSMLSPRFKSKTFANYKAKNLGQIKAVAEIKKYISNFNNAVGLILIGNPGTGKDHLCSAIIKEMIEFHNFTALHIEAIKIIRKIKESWKNKNAYESEVIEASVFPDLLVINEIDVLFNSDTEKIYITEIINDRYKAMKQTIICGNVTIEELVKIVGDRVVSRFREKNYNGESVIVFDWEDYRGRK